jgi:hypothetical protein
MKKIFSLVAVLCLVSTLAFGAGSTAYTNPYAAGSSFDAAASFHGNDGAWALGGSGGEASNLGTAKFTGFLGGTAAVGTANAVGATGATAGVADFGHTSISGAAIGTVVNTTAGGLSGYAGLGKGEAYNESKGFVLGDVSQGNYANEIGYQGGDKAQAGNTSGASFIGITQDKDSTKGWFLGAAGSGISMTGAAGTAGGSIASVDPNHSAFAATGNISGATVIGADCKDTSVYGSGGVETFVNKGNAFNGAAAGGTSGFGYSGNTLGAGGAVMNSTVNQNGSSFSAHSSGASFSAVK